MGLGAYLKQKAGPFSLVAFGRLLYSLFKFGSLKTILFSPPGHFYSPLPDLKAVAARPELFSAGDDLPGIDLNVERQLELLRAFAGLYADLPFPEDPVAGRRYHFRNPFFGQGDAIVLYSFLRHFKPRRVIEVGSGFSSAVMLDTAADFVDLDPDFVFIEPFAERLHGLIGISDRHRHRIIETPVQDVDPAEFDKLEENDILFIDSSHVVKCGSDVAHMVFRILPRLKPGVIVHIHDIHWPFQYPRDWILSGRSWNEVYFIRAFLQYNERVRIEYFNAYMAENRTGDVRDAMPRCLENPGGGLWLRIR